MSYAFRRNRTARKLAPRSPYLTGELLSPPELHLPTQIINSGHANTEHAHKQSVPTLRNLGCMAVMYSKHSSSERARTFLSVTAPLLPTYGPLRLLRWTVIDLSDEKTAKKLIANHRRNNPKGFEAEIAAEAALLKNDPSQKIEVSLYEMHRRAGRKMPKYKKAMEHATRIYQNSAAQGDDPATTQEKVQRFLSRLDHFPLKPALLSRPVFSDLFFFGPQQKTHQNSPELSSFQKKRPETSAPPVLASREHGNELFYDDCDSSRDKNRQVIVSETGQITPLRGNEFVRSSPVSPETPTLRKDGQLRTNPLIQMGLPLDGRRIYHAHDVRPLPKHVLDTKPDTVSDSSSKFEEAFFRDPNAHFPSPDGTDLPPPLPVESWFANEQGLASPELAEGFLDTADADTVLHTIDSILSSIRGTAYEVVTPFFAKTFLDGFYIPRDMSGARLELSSVIRYNVAYRPYGENLRPEGWNMNPTTALENGTGLCSLSRSLRVAAIEHPELLEKSGSLSMVRSGPMQGLFCRPINLTEYSPIVRWGRKTMKGEDRTERSQANLLLKFLKPENISKANQDRVVVCLVYLRSYGQHILAHLNRDDIQDLTSSSQENRELRRAFEFGPPVTVSGPDVTRAMNISAVLKRSSKTIRDMLSCKFVDYASQMGDTKENAKAYGDLIHSLTTSDAISLIREFS